MKMAILNIQIFNKLKYLEKKKKKKSKYSY